MIIAAAVGLEQLREKFSIHLEQMSPAFIAVEQNLKPHGVENQEINTSKPHIYFSLNGTYATLMMQQERRENEMLCLHIVSIIKSPEENKEMDPKCRMWDIHVWLHCFHPEPVAQACLSEHSHSPGG